MRDELLPSIPELRRTTEETFNQKFASDEEAFHDAFSNGEYHEEHPYLGYFAYHLNTKELASLFLPVCHALIVGPGNNGRGEPLKQLMALYEALNKWQQSRLKNTEELLLALEKVRPMVLKLAGSTPGWRDIRIFYAVMDIGIRNKMGLSGYDVSKYYE